MVAHEKFLRMEGEQKLYMMRVGEESVVVEVHRRPIIEFEKAPADAWKR